MEVNQIRHIRRKNIQKKIDSIKAKLEEAPPGDEKVIKYLRLDLADSYEKMAEIVGGDKGRQYRELAGSIRENPIPPPEPPPRPREPARQDVQHGTEEGEDEALKDRITEAIPAEKPNIKWEDIAGLEEVKRNLREAVILPQLENLPAFVKPWRGILLYGPPGTGKTLLAKAAASNLGATFYHAKSSLLLSKYFGESTKLVSLLFESARTQPSSLIFLDELDGMAPSRDSGIDQASRRVLTEFLEQMEGVTTSGKGRAVFMSATNKPWDVDDALIQRFEKRIYVHPPDLDARRRIVEINLKGAKVDSEAIDFVAERTDGYSGRDLAHLVQESAMTMLREENPDLAKLTVDNIGKYELRTRRLARDDFDRALKRSSPTLTEVMLERYREWQDTFGSE